MEDIGTKLEEVVKNLKEYADIQYQLTVLKAGNIISSVTAKILAAFVFALFLFMFTMFISVTAGLYMANLLGSLTKGFLVVAAFYFIVGLILFVFRNKLIIGPIRNGLIKQIFKDEK